jgi:hypothetical protein
MASAISHALPIAVARMSDGAAPLNRAIKVLEICLLAVAYALGRVARSGWNVENQGKLTGDFINVTS